MHLEKKIVNVMWMCLAIAININQVHRCSKGSGVIVEEGGLDSKF